MALNNSFPGSKHMWILVSLRQVFTCAGCPGVVASHQMLWGETCSHSRSPSCSCSWSCSHSRSRSYDNHHVAQDDRKPRALPKCVCWLVLRLERAISNTKAYQSLLDMPSLPRNLITRYYTKLRPTQQSIANHGTHSGVLHDRLEG